MELRCRDCGEKFAYLKEEQKRYAKKGWEKPFRCPLCRKENKRKYNDPYYGWESTMFGRGGRRGRHTHVYYAPHTVGGFR